jgi:hypothetical protein
MELEARKRREITKCESAQEILASSTTSSSALIILAGKRNVTNVGEGGTDFEVAMRAPMVGHANQQSYCTALV